MLLYRIANSAAISGKRLCSAPVINMYKVWNQSREEFHLGGTFLGRPVNTEHEKTSTPYSHSFSSARPQHSPIRARRKS